MLSIAEQINTLETILQTNNNQNPFSPEARRAVEQEIKRLKQKLAEQQAKL